MKITLEPVSGEYSLFREQYDQLIVDLRRQRLDVHLSVHRIEPQPAQADLQTPWDLIVRVGDVADAVAAIASITYAIRSRLRATAAPTSAQSGERSSTSPETEHAHSTPSRSQPTTSNGDERYKRTTRLAPYQ